MSRPHRPTPRTRSQLALCLGIVCAALLPSAGCSVNARFQAGTGTTPSNNSKVREARPDNSGDAAARERTRKRRAQEDIARIDREAKERVDRAEREAAERERAAEAEAERERQQAAADAEQRRREAAEAAAKADKAQKPMQRRQATGRFDIGTQGATGGKEADEVFQRRNTEISQSADEKKAAIRKQLEKNKSDILVAAERKRTEVQESIKDEPEKQP